MKIKVIDAPCGKGKTSFAIQMMNSNTDKEYVYCTPFLTEVDRIQKSVKREIKTPVYKDGRKINGFNDLVMNGESIATTHSTFTNSTKDTAKYISAWHYTLILDEVLDVLEPYNSVCNDNLSNGDLDLLFNEGFIKTDEYWRVHWLKGSYEQSKYNTVEALARKGSLLCISNTLFVWEFPYEIFDAFDEVYILTYMFEGSIFKPYLEYHGLDYRICSVDAYGNGYKLTEYHSDIEDRKKYKDLITIYEDEKADSKISKQTHKRANSYKGCQLSASWYTRASKDELKLLKNHLYNYFHNVTKAKAKDILWTCRKEQSKSLKGEGYTKVRRKLTDEEKALPKSEREQLEEQLNCFLPITARATNLYSDRSVLAYCYNCFPHPYIEEYFNNKNRVDGTNLHIDKDIYALSNLIQWIWRSRIRNGEPITIYIPSVRMRELFIKWLNGKI